MNVIKRIFLGIIKEISNLIENFIIYYPDTTAGISLRNWHFGKKFKKRGKVLNLMHGFRVTNPELVTVGDRFSCNIFTYINCGNFYGIYFGDNVAIGPNVYLRTENHKYNKKNQDIRDQGYSSIAIPYKDEKYSIILEGNNWIGANTVILPGTHIEKGAIIGAGSVISGRIKSNSVYLANKPILAFERNE